MRFCYAAVCRLELNDPPASAGGISDRGMSFSDRLPMVGIVEGYTSLADACFGNLSGRSKRIVSVTSLLGLEKARWGVL